MTTIKVQVKQDHLERLARKRTPLLALAELAWNGFDGDATTVDVFIDENDFGGIESVRIVDDGEGIPHPKAIESFRNLGASWKKGRTSPAGRKLHGQAGEGRFSAFSIGTHVRWITRWRDGKQVKEYEIVGAFDKLGSFEVTDPVIIKNRKPGTEVQITGIDTPPRSLLSDDTPAKLAELFALYLRQYPAARLRYDRKAVDPTALEEHVEDCEVEGVRNAQGEVVPVSLTVIEWKTKVERELVLCDADGFALSNRNVGIHAKGFNFTAYVKSPLVRDLYESNFLDFEDLHPQLRGLIDATKATLKDYFRRRSATQAQAVVEQWKEEKIYPYEGTARGPVEAVERQVFDVVALNVNEYLPDFATSDPRAKRFSLGMLKMAIESSPAELRRILQEVLDLPQDKRDDLVALLDRTSLSAIINASKVVVSRLEFLAGLEVVLFDTEVKKKTKERKHLQRLLADNTWIFGEEFNLSVDDESLDKVLAKHLAVLERDADEGGKVTQLDGRTGIVDLMLSKRIPLPKQEEFEHLVIELKRPTKRIDAGVLTQIEGYAFAVAEDERFRDAKVRWIFWAVSNEMDDHARRKVTGQRERPPGLVHHDERVTVWAKTWSQVIEECKGRLAFFRERLEYMATHEQGVEHLTKVHAKHVPEVAKAGGAENADRSSKGSKKGGT